MSVKVVIIIIVIAILFYAALYDYVKRVKNDTRQRVIAEKEAAFTEALQNLERKREDDINYLKSQICPITYTCKRNNLTHFEEQCKVKEKELEDLNKVIDYNQELIGLLKRKEQIIKEYRIAKQNSAKIGEQIAIKRGELEQNKTLLLSLSEDVRSKKAELISIQTKVDSNKDKLQILEYENRIVHNYNVAIQKKDEIAREIDSLQKQKGTLEATRRELAQLQLQKENLQEDLLSLERKINNKRKIEAEINEKYAELEKLKCELNTITPQLEDAISKVENAKEKLSSQENIPETLRLLAKAWGDYQNIIWNRHITHLMNKSHPITIEKGLDYRLQFREFQYDILEKYKEMEYRYEYLLSLFPELAKYVDVEAVLEDSNGIEEYEDRREGYLTKEEWKSLSDAEKSQLALDRYNEKRKRSKAQVGRDYEEYIAHLFRQQLKGCKITMFGEQRGLEDLGRDLIVQHRSKVYIVQCKRWSEDKVIREKHIMQLFGSTIEYCWDTQRGGIHPLDVVGKTIIPVFVSTTELSDTALRFAERLDVVVAQEPMGDYPQIKCNIGRDGRHIYHLPFDQQYNSTIIERERGEFMAWTVEEAEQKGYRRAKRYIGEL